MSIQDDFLKLVKDNKYIFKEIADKAGENEKSVHNMFKRRSVRCDVLEKLLTVIGKELQIVDKKNKWINANFLYFVVSWYNDKQKGGFKMAIKKDPQTRIAVRVSEDLKKKFEELCSNKAINGSALIRQFIIKWIEDNK